MVNNVGVWNIYIYTGPLTDIAIQLMDVNHRKIWPID